jgi:hypothetical protein
MCNMPPCNILLICLIAALPFAAWNTDHGIPVLKSTGKVDKPAEIVNGIKGTVLLEPAWPRRGRCDPIARTLNHFAVLLIVSIYPRQVERADSSRPARQ